MKLEEIVKENIKKLKEDTLEITKVVFKLNSLTMELPFINKLDKKVKESLTEKCRIVYDKCVNNLIEAHQFRELLSRKECKEYIVQINIYLNALSVFMYSINEYILKYRSKYNLDNDIEAIYNYYNIVAEKVCTFTKEHQKHMRNLGEEYYNI